jgi:hypothetical protein
VGIAVVRSMGVTLIGAQSVRFTVEAIGCGREGCRSGAVSAGSLRRTSLAGKGHWWDLLWREQGGPGLWRGASDVLCTGWLRDVSVMNLIEQEGFDEEINGCDVMRTYGTSC